MVTQPFLETLLFCPPFQTKSTITSFNNSKAVKPFKLPVLYNKLQRWNCLVWYIFHTIKDFSFHSKMARLMEQWSCSADENLTYCFYISHFCKVILKLRSNSIFYQIKRKAFAVTFLCMITIYSFPLLSKFQFNYTRISIKLIF